MKLDDGNCETCPEGHEQNPLDPTKCWIHIHGCLPYQKFQHKAVAAGNIPYDCKDVCKVDEGKPYEIYGFNPLVDINCKQIP